MQIRQQEGEEKQKSQEQKAVEADPFSYEEYIKQWQARLRMRQINFSRPNQPERAKTAQMKVIQKFIGRLKGDNRNWEGILSELQGLQLSKYVEEVSLAMVNNVGERQLRGWTEMATKLNLDYEQFGELLTKDLLKIFNTAFECNQDNKQRLKSLLLFGGELFVAGLPFSYKDIVQMLKKLVKAGMKKRCPFANESEARLWAYYYNCDIYNSFLIHFGSVFTQSTANWIGRWRHQKKDIISLPQMVPLKTRQELTRSFFLSYTTSCTNVLDSAFGRLKQLQQQLASSLKLEGSFNKATQNNYNELKQKFFFTVDQLTSIIEALGTEIQLKDYKKDIVQVESILKKYINTTENVEVFENEFEKELYLDVPQLCKTQNKASTEQDYKQFKEKLDKCKNKTDSEELAKAFELINNKKTRKMLAKDIMEYRKEYQLVTPYLCRIAAIIAVNFKDIGQIILEQLMTEYQKLRQNITNTFLINDKRSRNLKYLCELTKLGVLQGEKMIAIVQNLVDDLKGNNIELFIAALDSVGRFLYVSASTATKFIFLLSKLDNIMKQRSFPLFTTSQLLNAVSLLKPHPEPPKTQTISLTPIEKQAQDILSIDVTDDIAPIIEGINKLKDHPEGLKAIQDQMVKKIQVFDYMRVYNYAYLLNEANLSPLTDCVINEAFLHISSSIKTSNYQSCLLWANFLAQLYNYKLLKRTQLFDGLNELMKTNSQIAVINVICIVLQTCKSYLQSRKVTANNQNFNFLLTFKQYIHRFLYIPMLQEFRIIDIFQFLQPNLSSVSPATLQNFVKKMSSNKKEIDLSKAFDEYLTANNLKTSELKKEKKSPEDEQVDKKSQPTPQFLTNQGKIFENQFLGVMNSHIKDYAGRIARPAYVERIIEKKRDRKKVQEGESKMTIIGRSGNRFVRKDIVMQEDTQSKAE